MFPYNIVYILITVCHIEILGIVHAVLYNIVYILNSVSHRDTWNSSVMLSIQYSLYSNNSVSHRDTWNYQFFMLCCPYNIVYILITVCHIEILGISVFMLCCPYNIVYIQCFQ